MPFESPASRFWLSVVRCVMETPSEVPVIELRVDSYKDLNLISPAQSVS